MRFNNLNDWLSWQENLNPKEIDLGLERVSRVLARAGLSGSFDCPLITVAGTNGKGSVVAMLEAIAMATGLKVCSYTSPHLIDYNERIKIDGHAVDDDQLCEAFDRIDHARINHVRNGPACAAETAEEQLTYFEFGTLAAIDVFFRQQPDLVILEVGLGGRLDAVNIMDADVSVLTSVAIDHIDWLGDDRESIGFEKAGIFRTGKPVICGDPDPPDRVIEHAQQLCCERIQSEQDYRVVNQSTSSDASDSWTLNSCYGDISDLPQPSLAGEFQRTNAATAILALQALEKKGLLFSGSEPGNTLDRAARTGLTKVRLAGRFQQIKTGPQVYVDVAHNPQAAQALATQLAAGRAGRQNKTWAIMAMLSDKDVSGVAEPISDEIDYWCFAGLEAVSRGMSAREIIGRLLPESAVLSAEVSEQLLDELGDELKANQCTMLSDTVMMANTVKKACQFVLSKADKDDRIIIFGSFYTVAEAMKFFPARND